MGIRKPAVTGTLESSDHQVTMEPGEGNIEFVLENTVINQYENQTKGVVMEALEDLGTKGVRIAIVDKGALDCTIRARMKGAVFHTAEQYDNLPWGGTIR